MLEKKMHGITLIALVVTIVVLLILAGITISLVFSDNGIIKKAQEAANKTKEAVINEQTQMNEIADYMENMLNEIGGTIPDEPEGPEMPEGWDDTKVDAVESEDNVVVPVPKGYTASEVTGENTVKDGFVIYENTNGEDKYEPVTDESDIETAQTTRNQFVWVPVANPSDMYGTDKDGKKWGKTYYYVDANTIVPFYWKEQNGTMIIEDIEGYREPDVIDEDSSNNVTIIQLETEFNNMIESVEKYGGFYIGRYETGNLSQSEAVVVKNNTDIGDQTWYTMYNKSKGVAANSNVTTTMIWGCQWDAVLRWMYNSGDEEKKTYTYDSTGKGNYYGTNGNEAIPTGSNDAYAVNNIYDMAGNVYENTMEIVGSSNEGGKVARGGNYDGEPISSSVSFYAAFTGLFSNSKIGSRLALYM
mgnify:CR=1 FL=1